MSKSFPLREIRSFVRRDSRMTTAQRRAIETTGVLFNLKLEQGLISFEDVFHRQAQTILEIGFGSGHSLLEMAKRNPEHNFIGVETYLPGIGTLLLGVEELQIKNIRYFYEDAVKVLQQCIPDQSLDVIQIFFPDPWPKRRHHKRRLIQPEFVALLASKLKSRGLLHLATDWEDYAKHMMRVLTAADPFINLAGETEYANRSSQRPVVTKFERRGQQSGREIWELQFAKT